MADGAGSRDRSAEGSFAAVRAVIKAFEDPALALDDAALPILFAAAIEAIEDLAASSDAVLRDFDTTLAVCVLTGARVHIGQIGDSISVVELVGGNVLAVEPEAAFEYANETTFISRSTVSERLRVWSRSALEVSGVALSTDGLRMKILSNTVTGEPYQPFFDDLFSFVRSPTSSSDAIGRFIDGLADQTGDDKTLVVAVRGDPELVQGIGPERPVPRAPSAAAERSVDTTFPIGAASPWEPPPLRPDAATGTPDPPTLPPDVHEAESDISESSGPGVFGSWTRIWARKDSDRREEP